MIVHSGEYNYIVDVQPVNPPKAAGTVKYAAAVTEIVQPLVGGPQRFRLKAGDPYPCPRCHVPHVVDQPYADSTTADRSHLYVTCQGQRYFVGQVIADRKPGQR